MKAGDGSQHSRVDLFLMISGSGSFEQSMITGLGLDGLTAPMVVDGAMDGEMFTACAETILAPTLSKGDIVILDNLPAHKVSGARMAIEAVGANRSSSRHTRLASTPSNKRSRR